MLFMTSSEDYKIEVEYLVNFVCDYFQVKPVDASKQRKMKPK